MKRLVFILAPAVVAGGLLFAQTRSFTAYTDTSRLMAGESCTLTLECSAESSDTVLMPSFAEGLDMFSIMDYGNKEEKGPGGSRMLTQWYQLKPPAAGAYKIPEYKAVVTTPEGEKTILTTSPVFIEVTKAAVPDEQDIHGPKPQETVYITIRGWLYGLLSVLCLIISGVLIQRFRRKSNLHADEALIVSPHDEALEKLKAARALPKSTQEEIAYYFVFVSSVIREYIERRFLITAPEQTTEEFLDHILSNKLFLLRHAMMLRAFLTSCDLVKFARHLPGRQEIDDVLDRACDFVTETKERADAAV